MASTDNNNKTSELVTHAGGCHCGKVRFSVLAPAENLIVYNCK
jgi:hypothetical protein